MSNLNHGRPLFKVMDAGGGERIRTIDEELEIARTSAPADHRGGNGVPRCGLCGSTKVSSRRLRCAECVSDTQTVRAARTRPTAGAGPVIPSTRADSRSRSRICSKCYTEMPVSGKCGFCP